MPTRPLEDRYAWQPNAGTTGRYRDRATGKFVSELSVRGDLDKYIDAKNKGLDALTNQLRNREISLADWQLQMRAEIKSAHLNAAMVARGGRDQMTPADWGRTGRELRNQYEYLDKWAADIASGKVKLDGRANVRAQLYGDASRSTYEQNRRAVASVNGYTQERRILHAAESCVDCLEYAGLGWQPIGTLPRIGESQCRSNCRCTFEYQA
jgi:hypothetical protein